jgi:hypothetical protein
VTVWFAWHDRPYLFRAQPPQIRLEVYREAIAYGFIGSLQEGVTVMSSSYARWRERQWREQPRRVRERERQRDGRRWGLARAKVPPGPCHYCGAVEATEVDHIIPRNQGGTHDPSNLVRCCRRCNAGKGNRTPEQWQRGDSMALFWNRRGVAADRDSLAEEGRRRRDLAAPAMLV